VFFHALVKFCIIYKESYFLDYPFVSDKKVTSLRLIFPSAKIIFFTEVGNTAQRERKKKKKELERDWRKDLLLTVVGCCGHASQGCKHKKKFFYYLYCSKLMRGGGGWLGGGGGRVLRKFRITRVVDVDSLCFYAAPAPAKKIDSAPALTLQ
jgi:hypothetical protein